MADKITIRDGETTSPDEIEQAEGRAEGASEDEISVLTLARRKVAEYLHRSRSTNPESNCHNFNIENEYFSATLRESGIDPSSDSEMVQIVESLIEANIAGDVFENDIKRVKFIMSVVDFYRYSPNSPEKVEKIEDFINTVDFAQLHTVACSSSSGKACLDPIKLSNGQEVSAESCDYSKGRVDIELSANGVDDMHVAFFVERLFNMGKSFTMVISEPSGYVFSVKISISELDKEV